MSIFQPNGVGGSCGGGVGAVAVAGGGGGVQEGPEAKKRKRARCGYCPGCLNRSVGWWGWRTSVSDSNGVF